MSALREFVAGNNYTGNVGLKDGLHLYVEHSNEGAFCTPLHYHPAVLRCSSPLWSCFAEHVALTRSNWLHLMAFLAVWNFGFPQYALNKAMAEWEGYNSTDPKTGGKHSNLAKPLIGRPDVNCTTNDGDCWTHRRHARRVLSLIHI